MECIPMVCVCLFFFYVEILPCYYKYVTANWDLGLSQKGGENKLSPFHKQEQDIYSKDFLLTNLCI